MFQTRINPGDKIPRKEIYEVWGDVIMGAGLKGSQIISSIYDFLIGSKLPDSLVLKKVQAAEDNRPFLVLEWNNNMIAHIDARAFGTHLDVYVIVALHRGLTESADPNERIANLEGFERRNLQIFQTLIRYAIEQSIEKLEGGMIN